MLTIKEAAEVWSVSPKTVWRMIQRKELEAEKVGRQWRIRPREVCGGGS